MAKPKLFKSRTEATLAAEQKTREMGFSSEEAAKWSSAFPYGDMWQAWYLDHLWCAQNITLPWRRPITEEP